MIIAALRVCVVASLLLLLAKTPHDVKRTNYSVSEKEALIKGEAYERASWQSCAADLSRSDVSTRNVKLFKQATGAGY